MMAALTDFRGCDHYTAEDLAKGPFGGHQRSEHGGSAPPRLSGFSTWWSSQPMAGHDTPEGRHRGRRVELGHVGKE